MKSLIWMSISQHCTGVKIIINHNYSYLDIFVVITIIVIIIIMSRSKVVTFDIKVTIEISCLMDFSDYPFDDHTCNFQVIIDGVHDRLLVTVIDSWWFRQYS